MANAAEKKIEIPVVQEGGRLRAILPEARLTEVPGADPYGRPPVNRQPRQTPGIFPEEESAGYRWAPWGENDCMPTEIRQKIYTVPMAAVAIKRLTEMMFGNGIMYYRNADLVDGPEVRRAFIPKVEQFLQRNRICTEWLAAQLLDYRFYMNSFSELIFNNRRDQILRIFHKPAEFSRLSVQNVETGQIEYLYYSPRFAEGYHPRQDQIAAIPLLDWAEEERYLERFTGYKLGWHSRLPTPASTYYARPLWLGLFKKDGWIDVSAAVPKIISSMQHNQLVLKYHILIPESYFEIRYRDWHTYTDIQRNVKIDALIDKINSTLRGVDNIYGSIATVFREDPVTRSAMGKIEIVPVDDKLKKDAWVPSSDRADAQIVQGLGLHPSQVGLAPEGGKMGAGSGSDQREAFNTGITLNTLDQMIVLEPLNWLARFNAQADPEWDITFCIDHTYHTTYNNQETGLQPSPTTLQVQ